jgi:CxxC-x17-CxxC domain-containing protein
VFCQVINNSIYKAKPDIHMDRFKTELAAIGLCKRVCTENITGSEKEKMSYPREMHKATCADCGKECDVPFKPDGTRPVYCRECYSKRRPPRRY